MKFAHTMGAMKRWIWAETGFGGQCGRPAGKSGGGGVERGLGSNNGLARESSGERVAES